MARGPGDSTGTIRQQYEDYPYPPRDPADEAKSLRLGSPSHLWELNHCVFAGRRDLDRPFRALVAGGGTGDGTIMLAQQLADVGAPAEIVYLDLSDASREIAEARAKARGLTSVSFLHGDLRAAELGPFDYIDCCGVLHHLDDPAAGFAALRDALAPDGGMGVMLYGAAGRTGVYHVQALLKMIAAGRSNPDRVEAAKRLLADLPPTNWLVRNPFVEDHKTLSDAGLFDLLLHSTDRAYDVVALNGLVEEAGLRIAALIEPARYDPDTYLHDPDLRASVAGLGWLERCHFAELLAGNITKHIAYLVHGANTADTVARPDDAKAIPVMRDVPAPAIARAIGSGGKITVDAGGMKIEAALPPLAAAMLRALDGKRTLDQIRRALDPVPDPAAFQEQFAQVYRVLNGFNQMYLRF